MYFGFVARHFFRREITGDNTNYALSANHLQTNMEVFTIFQQLFVAIMFTEISGSHPSVINLPVKDSLITALINLCSKSSTMAKQ